MSSNRFVLTRHFPEQLYILIFVAIVFFLVQNFLLAIIVEVP